MGWGPRARFVGWGGVPGPKSLVVEDLECQVYQMHPVAISAAVEFLAQGRFVPLRVARSRFLVAAISAESRGTAAS